MVGMGRQGKKQASILQNLNITLDSVIASPNGLEYALKSDAIIISSPTPTHMDYLRALKDYKGYILVEKPMITNLRDGEEALSWPDEIKQRIRINYNFPYTQLAKIFWEIIDNNRVGKPLYLDIHTSHQLEGFKDSWRAHLNNPPLEMSGTHYLDFLGHAISKCSTTLNHSKDTSIIYLETNNGFQIRLFHSYNAMPIYRWFLFGTEGYWSYNGEKAILYKSPGNPGKRYAPPEIIEETNLDFQEMWNKSLVDSMDNFITHVREGVHFRPEDFDRSLLMTKQAFN